MNVELESTLLTPASLEAVQASLTADLEKRKQTGAAPGCYASDPRLARFHVDRLRAAVERSDEHGLMCLSTNGEPAAIVAIGGPSWHSPLAGCRIARLTTCHILTPEFSVLMAIAGHVRGWCKADGFDMLSARAAAGLHEWVAAVTQDGWRHVGTSLKYVLQPIPASDTSRTSCEGVSLREAVPGDLEDLQRIIRGAHDTSHFFNEPDWDRSVGEAIFSEWMERTLSGSADRVVVAEHQGHVAGFTSLLHAKAVEPYIEHAVGVLDFICVDRDAQGAGIGGALISEALRWARGVAPALELRTMLDNHRASSWYQRLGFRLTAADHHFHAWL